MGAILRTEKLSKQRGETAGKKLAAKVAAKLPGREAVLRQAEKISEAMAKKTLEQAVRKMFKDHDPDKRITFDDFWKSFWEDVLEPAIVDSLGGAFARQLGVFESKACAKVFAPHTLKGLGKVHFEAYAAGANKIIEEAVQHVAGDPILEAAEDPRKAGDLSNKIEDHCRRLPNKRKIGRSGKGQEAELTRS